MSAKQSSPQAAPPAPEASPRDDPIAEVILDLLAARGAGKSIAPSEAAQAFAAARSKAGDPPDAWRRYKMAVRQQAIWLARAGRIAILRKGKPVDPRAPIKGVIRLALTGDREKG